MSNITFPERLQLAQLPTPIHPLDSFVEAEGGSFFTSRLWVKRDDMTSCAVSGNKIRKLEFTLAEAKSQGAEVIITCGGVQSNHARATAILCAQLKLHCHLLLRGEIHELNQKGNHFLDLLVGAKIDTYRSSEYLSNFQNILAEAQKSYQAAGMKTFFIPTGASDATGVWGYVEACRELQEQMMRDNLLFDDIVCACGSGGTLAGLVAGNYLYALGARIWGINVCDNADYFMKKARQDLHEWKEKFSIAENVDSLPIQVIDGYVGEGYAKANPETYRIIKRMAEVEGLILDPIYTGKAFYGLLSEIRKGRFDDSRNILFIHTGGIYGLLADDKIQQYL